jgi:hypothetical protein
VHFRYDFVHSIVTDPATGVVTHHPPCGVKLCFEWLLHQEWRSRLPRISTRGWIAAQRLIDRLRLRGDRWRQLPGPQRFAP